MFIRVARSLFCYLVSFSSFCAAWFIEAPKELLSPPTSSNSGANSQGVPSESITEAEG